MPTDTFFDAQTDESRVKTRIVASFFVGWARIISGYQRKNKKPVNLGYADLFAGRGRYVDGNEGTALVIAKHVLENDIWRPNTKLLLNEADPELAAEHRSLARLLHDRLPA